MKPRVVPFLAALTSRRQQQAVCYETTARGLAVLGCARFNKGSAFSAEERQTLGLTGLLPPETSDLSTQVKRAYIQYERLPDSLSKNLFLTTLRDHNEVLFYRLLADHLREMIPVVNDLTVGLAMAYHHQHDCRRPRGVYLSIDHPESIGKAFANFGAGPGDIDLILATDAEQIPGLGDWGVSGIDVAIGKLAIYTAAGGVDPARVIPVMLDVGTNRESLRNDPTYLGNRHERIRGERYDAFIEAYVKTVINLFPNALLQWEDFAPSLGRRILERYRHRMCTFNDDIQGTGAVTLAVTISAARACGTPLRHHRVVIFGAGTAGIGIADQLRDAMVREGLSSHEATKRFWCVDRSGLLTSDPGRELQDYQASYARKTTENGDWKRDVNGSIGHSEVVHRVKPTMLIGTSAASGSFTEEIVKEMASHTARPIILVLSNPAVQAEATPSDLVCWTDGQALIATGSLFAPVTHRGVTHVIAQVNNAMFYPGLGLGAIVSRASRISNNMLAAAASALSSLVTVRPPGSSLLPHIDDLRAVSLTVAVAVAEAAEAEGLARVRFDDIVQQVRDAMWEPEYLRILAT